MVNFFFYASMIGFMLVCIFLMLLVLIQKGRGGGLASAFGGAGGNTAFGSKTGDVLTWATSIVFGLFLFLAVVLNLLANQKGGTAQAAAPAVTAPAPLMPDDQPPTPTTANAVAPDGAQPPATNPATAP